MAGPDAKPFLGAVVVIGGNGFLGHHVVRQLVDEWQTTGVTSLDLRCSRNRIAGATYHEVDITDAAALDAAVAAAAPALVVHTASPPSQAGDAVADALFRRVNVEGTANVVAACQRAGVRALVYTSSASVLSDHQSDLRYVDERWPVVRSPRQIDYYAETKAAAEALVLQANGQAGLATAAIRPAGIFGEGDTMMLKHLIDICRAGRTGVQIGPNNNLFDFSYVGNVAHAHLLAGRLLLQPPASGAGGGRVDGEAFLVTNGEPVYFWDFSRAVWRAAGSPLGIDHVWALPTSVGYMLGLAAEVAAAVLRRRATFTRRRIYYSTMTRYYNIDKARSVLQYEPRVGLDQAVKQSVQWFVEQEQPKQTL